MSIGHQNSGWKYSSVASTIKIILEDCVLKFISNGEKIKEFDKEEVRKVLLEKENKNLDEIGKSKENLEKYLGE